MGTVAPFKYTTETSVIQINETWDRKNFGFYNNYCKCCQNQQKKKVQTKTGDYSLHYKVIMVVFDIKNQNNRKDKSCTTCNSWHIYKITAPAIIICRC